MAGFPITQAQLESHLSDYGLITNSTLEDHLQQAAYVTGAGMREWVMGELKTEHDALEKRLVDSVRELQDRTAATQIDFDVRVGNANAVFDQHQADLTAGFEARDAQLREHVDRSSRANLESRDTL